MMHSRHITSATKKQISIFNLLIWAFRDECAQLELADRRDHADRGYGFGMEYVLLERAQLGVDVDSSRGRSTPHEDADIVSAAVSVLPEAFGGVGMALQITELARAGAVPDTLTGVEPRCVPVEWRGENQFGRLAKTEVIDRVTYMSRRGKRSRDVVMCPVTYKPTAAQIASCRRNYLDWWGALHEIKTNLQIGNALFRHELTDKMPPMEPWK